jgi:hypothetical protein
LLPPGAPELLAIVALSQRERSCQPRAARADDARRRWQLPAGQLVEFLEDLSVEQSVARA